LRQPIEVRPRDGRFEIVYGDRRYLAHRLLGVKEISAFVRESNDEQTAVIRGIENLQRENLTASEEAAIYVSMRDEAHLSQNGIARRTGRSQATVKRYLEFASQPEYVRKAVDDKRISLRTLEVFYEIDDPVAFKYYFEMAAANGVTEPVARGWVDDYFKTRLNRENEESKGSGEPNIEQEVKPVYVTCEGCLEAVEVKVLRHLLVCRKCASAFKERAHAKT
jgi:ParB/RepB/Spo0J family partition protein